MAKSVGRDWLVKKNGTTIAAVRTKTLTITSNAVDVTNDDDDGIVTYLADTFSTEEMQWTVEGVTDSDVLWDAAVSTTASDRHFDDLTFTNSNGDVISGTFIMTNFSVTGNSGEAATFSATFVRSGIHTNTPA